jgi:hypothetical protein
LVQREDQRESTGNFNRISDTIITKCQKRTLPEKILQFGILDSEDKAKDFNLEKFFADTAKKFEQLKPKF